jgi:hypothetical protein
MPEYRIKIIYKDGRTNEGNRYFESDQLFTVKTLVVNKLRESLGGLFSIQEIEITRLPDPPQLFDPFK